MLRYLQSHLRRFLFLLVSVQLVSATSASAQNPARYLLRQVSSDLAASDNFGYSVAIDGDIMVAGTGAGDGAYIFYRNQGGANKWGQFKKLLPTDYIPGDRFGQSVAISGNTVIVGAPGFGAYFFERNSGGTDNWGQTQKKYDGGCGYFPDSVAISGSLAILGSASCGGSLLPSSYIHGRDQGGTGNWGQIKQIFSGDGVQSSGFGAAVKISGTTVVVGAPNTGDLVGTAYVFEQSSGGPNNWGLTKTINAYPGYGRGQDFGRSVAISGNYIVVGAPHYGWDQTFYTGAAYLYGRDTGGASNWGLVQTLSNADPTVASWYGYSVAISGTTVAITAPYIAGSGSGEVGATYIFKLDASSGVWRQYAKTYPKTPEYFFGNSTAISGLVAVTGQGYYAAGTYGSAFVMSYDWLAGTAMGSQPWEPVRKIIFN